MQGSHVLCDVPVHLPAFANTELYCLLAEATRSESERLAERLQHAAVLGGSSTCTVLSQI